uniref:Nucleotidyltransferase domain-containing protein n=1 Tax=Candidatus Kentrum sp. FM TaxID=2126340 RepID=A0A450TQX5_9GAMM|nr:MAG: Nucleotidyltransferase domain-containing protein [Candidatus Kentron sp. FM]VFJ70502.1 MAG: Nucleotidyltransferase domain-containing protein [Candidatus Kentron sp. FM]VFK14754.1 MAG: Nucleotidyltransferase domain-containing protein [Candidatus Kentron sp. FM]
MSEMSQVIGERFGLDQTVIDKINGVLAGFASIEKAMLYGSRAKGNHRPGSDIDLAIVGSGVTQEELLEMDGELDDLLLPYTIDLCRFHEIRNPDLIGHIDRVGVVFFPDSKDG